MLHNREKLEKLEDMALAPYGFRSRDTRGRHFPDDEPDFRTSFQRDRDRIIHTTAFRRLEYKTQVFIIDEGDYYRTRLTHTLEVSQIGRTIARALGANEDLTEAICLAHDLGHPPFGHSGEGVLSRLMMDHGGFEHNRQSFRIVSELEKRFPDFSGLNLTWEVLEGLVKHETEYDRADARDYNPDLRGHLEAQIANVADELAYTAHDLDDGLRSRLIHPGMLEGMELWEMVVEEAGIDRSTHNMDDLTRHIVIRTLIGMQVNDLIQTTDRAIYTNGIKSVEDVQKLAFNVVTFSENLHRRNRQMKDFLFSKLYRHFRVVRMAKKAEHILSDLFHAYLAEPEILPAHYLDQIEQIGLERTSCDYIAGMTDRYAIEEHRKIFEPGTLP